MSVFQREEGVVLRTNHLVGHTDAEEFDLDFSADSTLLVASVLYAGHASIWDIMDQRRLLVVREDAGYAGTFSPSKELIATCGDNGVSVWDIRTGLRTVRMAVDRTPEQAVLVFQREERLVFVGGTRTSGSRAQVFDLANGEEIVAREFDRGEFAFDALCQGEQVIVYSYRQDTTAGDCFFATDLSSGDRMFQYPMCQSRMPRVSYDKSRVLICVDHAEGLFRVVNPSDGRGYDVGLGTPFKILSTALSVDGNDMVVTDSQNGVRVWERGRMVRELDVAHLLPKAIMSPSQSLVALVVNLEHEGVNRTVFMDLVTCRILGRAADHPFVSIENHTFSPNGRWFVSGLTNTAMGTVCNAQDPCGTVYLTDLAPIHSRSSHIAM